MNENYIKEFISALDSNRKDKDIAGHHEDLNLWISWYKGIAPFHQQKTIIEGVQTTRLIKQGGMAKQCCSTWASSFLNEDIELTLPDKNQDKLLDSILEINGFKSKINTFAEKYFGLSIGAVVEMPTKFNVNTETGEFIDADDVGVKISLLDATRIVPITIDDDEVTELGIVRYSTNKCTLQVHLINENGFYDVSEVVGDKDGVDYKFDYTKAQTWHTKTKTPLFQVWHPQVCDNKVLKNQLGTSIFADAISELETYDMMVDRFFIEFKNGAKKRFISSDLEYVDYDGNAHRVPLSDEDVYLPPSKIGDAPSMVQEHNSDLRVEQFVKAMNYQANLIGKKCYLGDNAFELDTSGGGRPVQTATASILKEKEGQRHLVRNENFAKLQLKRMAMAIQYIYNAFCGGGFNFKYEDISISFDDNIIEDTTTKKELQLREVAAGVRSMAEYRANWFDEDYDTALSFLQENGLLIDKYMTALTSGAISPTMYVNLVYGDNVEGKDELIAYISEHMSTPVEEDYNADEETEIKDVEEDDEGDDE